MAARVEVVDALVLVDAAASPARRRRTVWQTAGRDGRPVRRRRPAHGGIAFDGVAQRRRRAVPSGHRTALQLNDAPIGALYLATSLDQAYAESLAELSRHAHRDRAATASSWRPRSRRNAPAPSSRRWRFRRSRRHDRSRWRIPRVPATRAVGDTELLRAGLDRRIVAATTRDAMRSLRLIAVRATGSRASAASGSRSS